MQTAENLDNKIKEFWPKDGPPIQEVEKYVKKYSKEKIVIKCGGRVLLDPNLFNNFITGNLVRQFINYNSSLFLSKTRTNFDCA